MSTPDQAKRWSFVVELVAHKEIDGEVARVAIPVSVELLTDMSSDFYSIARQIDAGFERLTIKRECERRERQQAALAPASLTDLLSLVGVSVSPIAAMRWTIEQRKQAAEWAGAVHIQASDNNVEVPERPDFLPPERARWDPFA